MVAIAMMASARHCRQMVQTARMLRFVAISVAILKRTTMAEVARAQCLVKKLHALGSFTPWAVTHWCCYCGCVEAAEFVSRRYVLLSELLNEK